MSAVKTAISVPDSILRKAEALAKDLNISRSRLFTLAVRDFVEKYRDRRILQRLNAAWENDLSAPEKLELEAMKGRQRRVILDEW